MSAPELSLYYSEAEEDGRGYRNPVTDERAPSVTTILKLENKDNLIQWAANLTLQWAVENWQWLGSNSDEAGLRRGKYRWKDARDERATVGTAVHEYIECLNTGGWDFPELTEEQESIVEQYHLFTQAHIVEPVLSEVTLWNHTYEYAGTADGLWRIDGVLRWIDLKTSKNTWPGHKMQLSALKNSEKIMVRSATEVDGWAKFKHNKTGVTSWWSEQDLPETDSSAIVHIRGGFRDRNGDWEPPMWEYLVADPVEEALRFEAFKAYRNLYAVNEELKSKGFA